MMRKPVLTIIGGGYSGASVAIHLLRLSDFALHINIVEPREHLAEGLAFSSPHVDHRLNGPAAGHSVLPDDPQHLTRWCQCTGLLLSDPQASSGGAVFIRRSDFARYVRETLEAFRDSSEPGSVLTHIRDEAGMLSRRGQGYTVHTRRSGAIDSDMVIVATGNPPRAVPHPLRPLLDGPCLLPDPYDLQRLSQVRARARVLVVGTGLTALDTVCALIRQGHQGPVTMVSRRGLMPRAHPVVAPASRAQSNLQRIHGPLPHYTQSGPPEVRRWLAGLRQSIRAAAAHGKSWHEPFDELRDVVWRLWPQLPLKEKRRFDRLLRPWYDAHRFRVPGPTAAMVEAAERAGQVSVKKARISSARARHGCVSVTLGNGDEQEFDVVVNATGFEMGGMHAFVRAGIDAGLLTPAMTGNGLSVDESCCSMGSDGEPQSCLRVIGPPTAGVFGDPLGTVFIGAHIVRVMPEVLAQLRAMAEAA